MSLLALALAPGIVLLIYIYIQDKYEHEPLKEVLKAFLAGSASAIVLIIIYLTTGGFQEKTIHGFIPALHKAFFQAALPEETIKFIPFLLLFYKNKEFNEWFDGIVYASVISLGFATVENILYVTSSDISTGISRAFLAVPAHFIMGITQGFFFSLAKFKNHSLIYISLALISAIIVHTLYDALLFTGQDIFLLIFFLYFISITWLTKRLIKFHLNKSQFKSRQN